MELMDRERSPHHPLRLDAFDSHDSVVVLRGVTWDQYVALNDAQGEGGYPRMAYLDGELEVMVTSSRHELVKTILARMVEVFSEEADVALIGLGNTTWRNKVKRVGLEPDECYAVGKIRKVPDLAIEVVYTSGGVTKLERYRRLGVREVWFWIDDKIEVYRLARRGYRKFPRSVVLRGIELDAIARRIVSADVEKQTSVVRAYRKSLQRTTGSTSR
jgi:Uma2 family endonuclease